MTIIKSLDEEIIIRKPYRGLGLSIHASLIMSLNDGKTVRVREKKGNILKSESSICFYQEKNKDLISQVIKTDKVYLAEPYYTQCFGGLAQKIMNRPFSVTDEPDNISLKDYGADLASFDVTLESLSLSEFDISTDVLRIIMKRTLF